MANRHSVPLKYLVNLSNSHSNFKLKGKIKFIAVTFILLQTIEICGQCKRAFKYGFNIPLNHFFTLRLMMMSWLATTVGLPFLLT